MRLDDKIEQLRVLIGQRDEIDQQIVKILSDDAVPVRPSRQRKWHKANRRGEGLQSEIAEHHRAKRQHPETARIEEMLLAGGSVPEILEKVDVSAPTVYVIKARLKKEGKFT